VTAPSAYLAHAFPVSVKGVAVQDGEVLLLENERNEWELPGGKLELGEDPPDCVVREISEETGWQVTAGPLLDCWQYHIRRGSNVVIVTYGCYVRSTGPPVISNEHKRAGLFAPGQVPELVGRSRKASRVTGLEYALVDITVIANRARLSCPAREKGKYLDVRRLLRKRGSRRRLPAAGH
jgi:8-oxo-dGTP pyrophosphatase MutT (NUDIX family)